MEFKDIIKRAVSIRELYAQFENRTGRTWTREEIALGFVGDVGDLVKLTMAAEGIREIPDAQTKLSHELADCLWSILVLAQLYDVDIEAAFFRTMDDIEAHLRSRN
jgi:NTP pyrophosphatase (non-canonical NTP hydrolase)